MRRSDTTLAVLLGAAGLGVCALMGIAAKRELGARSVHPEDPYLQHEREQAEAAAKKAAAAAAAAADDDDEDITDFGGRA